MKAAAFLTAVLCLLAMATDTVGLSLEGKLEEIDSLIRQKLENTTHVGLAVGIVEGGQIVFAKGYGLRNKTDPESHVTNQTIFAIASLTKAFTSYAMDRLVSVDGVADWNDLVTRHIPEFRMSNVHTTTHVRIKDLLSHVTGIPRHDALWSYSDFPREEFITRLPYLETNYYLREKFQYSNIMYAVAGIVMERVTNHSWEQIVQRRIFEPLNMTRSYTHITEAWEKGVGNIAQPHSVAFDTGEVISVPWILLTNVAPCGSIVSSIEDMSKWMQTQLHLSERSQVMHVAHINAPSELSDQFDFAYGYGWVLRYYHGQNVVWHNGGVDGFSSYLALFPASNRGVVVLANADFVGGLISNLPYEIADILASNESNREARPLVRTAALLHEKDMMMMSSAMDHNVKMVMQHEPVDDAEQYEGRYKNPGYGGLEVSQKESKLFATYNTVEYALAPKNVSDFFTATAQFPRTGMYGCSFVRDASSGDVLGVRFTFETSVAPILFEKQLPKDLYSLDYLESFVGTYAYFEFTVSGGRRRLVISAPSQGLLAFADGEELRQYKEDWFLLEDGNYLFRFVRTSSGQVSGLRLYLGEMSVAFNKN